MCQRFFRGPKAWLRCEEIWRRTGLESMHGWCSNIFSLKLLWVLDTLVLFASDMWSCEMFFGRQWKHHSIQNICHDSFCRKKHLVSDRFEPEYTSQKSITASLSPKKSHCKLRLLNSKLSQIHQPFFGPLFLNHFGSLNGADLASETTKEKTLNAHEATVTSLSASPPTAPYDPRLVSCSKAWNKKLHGYQKWKMVGFGG